PHAHSVVLDPANKYLFVNDLGIDRIVSYSVDGKTGKVTANAENYATKPAAGPRHFKFHPNDKFAFVNNELDMTVTSLAYDASNGKLTEIQTLSTLPDGYKITKTDSVADIHVSPDGRFLYVSNRGHDSIASYAIDANNGTLTPIEFTKTGGKMPRNFAIDPSGSFLLAANQTSNSITVFKIDKKTGRLISNDVEVSIPRPVCLVFAK
ncbi:MAG TPA: lactonase family protein, partial [Pyrinomonadaceae bacterium]|nr:lactonase family protein [Pyrinomonadaceae bacterium]